MSSTTAQDGTRACECGCGRSFERIKVGPHERKFYSSDCRVRYWNKKHTRKILNKRPRSKRAKAGVEFQLGRGLVDEFDSAFERSDYRTRSELAEAALRAGLRALSRYGHFSKS